MRQGISSDGSDEAICEAEVENASFSYDKYGRMTRMDRGSYSEIYTYNIFGRLGSARKATNTRFPDYSYSYTGRGLLSTEHVYTGGRTRDRYLMYYSDGLVVKKSKTGGLDDIYYRGPDQGGGVAGINYAEKSDGTGLNYKFYNLRGDVVRTENSLKRRISQSNYDAFGEHTDLGSITTDTFTANTKEENSLGLLNEGKRWRSLKYGVFLTPDPLEYVDGLNPYIYCNQNPWGQVGSAGIGGRTKPLAGNRSCI